jgi:prophage regulatory protein
MNHFIFLRKPQLREKFQVSNTTIFEWTKKGLLPPPVSLGFRAVGWPDYEIDHISRSMIAGKPKEDIKLLVRELISLRTEASYTGEPS